MTDTELPTTSYAVLGLLADGPRSRYDIVRSADFSIANFWTIAKSQVYGELSRLEKLGFVKSKEVRQKGLPDKRLFEITPSGKEALEQWLADPTYEEARYRSGFLVKLFFAEIAPEGLGELVSRYKAGIERHVANFGPMTESIPRTPDFAYMRVTALFGMRILRTTLEWIKEDVEPLVGKSRSSKGERSTKR